MFFRPVNPVSLSPDKIQGNKWNKDAMGVVIILEPHMVQFGKDRDIEDNKQCKQNTAVDQVSFTNWNVIHVMEWIQSHLRTKSDHGII